MEEPQGGARAREEVRRALGIRFCQPLPYGASNGETLLWHCMLEAADPGSKGADSGGGLAGQLAEDEYVHHVLCMTNTAPTAAGADEPLEKAYPGRPVLAGSPEDSEESELRGSATRRRIGEAGASRPAHRAHGSFLPLYASLHQPRPGAGVGRIEVFRRPRQSLRSLLAQASHRPAWDRVAVRGLTCAVGASYRDLQLRFIFLQLVRATAAAHRVGTTLGAALEPENVAVGDDGWLYLLPVRLCAARAAPAAEATEDGSDAGDAGPGAHGAPLAPPGYYEPLVSRWTNGRASNLEYLMAVNRAAGRVVGGLGQHPILPWVSDFSEPWGGWRDLQKSKYRIAKGNEQLDSTYRHSSPRHHVPESLATLTLAIYLARALPLDELRRTVRANFVPEHYPADIGRLYAWTPDECIPEFFVDPDVFRSQHADLGLGDLEVPSWAQREAREEGVDAHAWFCKYHRRLLESEVVSAQLHHWIDLNFGACLSGKKAVANMNVPLKLCRAGAAASPSQRRAALGRERPQSEGPWAPSRASEGIETGAFVQLFARPHPRRQRGVGLEVPRVEDALSWSGARSSNVPGREPDAADVLGTLLGGSWARNMRSSTMSSASSVASTASGGEASGPRRANPGPPASILQMVEESPFKGSLLGGHHSAAHAEEGKALAVRPAAAENGGAEPSAAEDGMFSLGPKSAVGHAADGERRVLRAPELRRAPERAAQPVDENAVLRDMVRRAHIGPRTTANDQPRRWLVDIERLECDSTFAAETAAFLDPLYEAPDEQERSIAGDAFRLGVLLVELYSDTHAPAIGRIKLRPGGGSILDRSALRDLPPAVAASAAALVHRDATERIAALRSIFAAAEASPLPRSFLRDFKGASQEDSDAEADELGRETGQPDDTGDAEDVRAARCRRASLSAVGKAAEGLDRGILGALFPPSFDLVHQYLHDVEMLLTSDDPFRGSEETLKTMTLRMTISALPILTTLPVASFTLLLPKLLRILSDPASFDAQSDEVDEKRRTQELEDSGRPLIMEVITLVEDIGSKIGPQDTEHIVIPALCALLKSINDKTKLVLLLRSKLWSTIVRVAGPAAFIRSVLPILVHWVHRGKTTDMRRSRNNQCILYGKGANDVQELKHDRGCEEFAAEISNAVVGLAAHDVLGPGLVARYLVPALVSRIARIDHDFVLWPIDSSAAESDADVKTPGSQYPAIASCLVRIGNRLGYDAVAILIVAPLLNEVLPRLQDAADATRTDGTIETLGHVLRTLCDLLPILSGELVMRLFVVCARIPVHQLLLAIPLPPTPQHSEADAKRAAARVLETPGRDADEVAAERARERVLRGSTRASAFRLRVHGELCRLVALVAHSIGVEQAIDIIFPAADKFFAYFVSHYSAGAGHRRAGVGFAGVPKEARDMVQELFMPLCALVGPEKVALHAPTGASTLPTLLGMNASIVAATSRAVQSAAAMPADVPSEEPRPDLLSKTLQWLQRQAVGSAAAGRKRDADDEAEGADVVREHARGASVNVTISPEGLLAGDEDGVDTPMLLEGWFNFDSPAEVDVPAMSAGGPPVESLDDSQDAGARTPDHGTEPGPLSPASSPYSPHKMLLRADPGQEGAKSQPQPQPQPRIIDSALSPFGKAPHVREREKLEKRRAELKRARRGTDVAWLVGGGSLAFRSFVHAMEAASEPPGVDGGVPPSASARQPVVESSLEAQPWQRAGRLWTMHMAVQTAFDGLDGAGGVRALCVDRSERLICAGADRGAVRLWSLPQHPPRPHGEYTKHTEAVQSIDFFQDASRVVSCDGTIHLWDPERGANLSVYSGKERGDSTPFVTAKVLPAGHGVYPSLGDAGAAAEFGGALVEQQILAASRRGLFHLDVRSRTGEGLGELFRGGEGGGRGRGRGRRARPWVLQQRADWRVYRYRHSVGLMAAAMGSAGSISAAHGLVGLGSISSDSGALSAAQLVSTPYHRSLERDLYDLPLPPSGRHPGIQCIGSSVDGNWVCAGGSDGTCWIADWRSGRPIHAWRAHEGSPIVATAPIGSKQLLTVSLDKSAVLWDLRGQHQPERLATVNGLPDAQGGMLPSTVLVDPHRLRGSGSATQDNVLFAFSGHKAAAGLLPRPGAQPAVLQQSHFRDAEGQKVRKQALAISAAAMLPLRRLLVLGCEDGMLRICF